MLFTPTKLKDVHIIDLDKRQDERGFFARAWCYQELADRGLDSNLVQCSISFNHQKGTLRGMHLQLPPYAETKIVRCIQGAIYDVCIDLRSNSETYLDWVGVELSAENRKALYIPKGFAHGFQTLADNSEIFYQISDFYAPESARGLRWNDPKFNINWPLQISTISDKDRQYPDFSAQELMFC